MTGRIAGLLAAATLVFAGGCASKSYSRCTVEWPDKDLLIGKSDFSKGQGDSAPVRQVTDATNVVDVRADGTYYAGALAPDQDVRCRFVAAQGHVYVVEVSAPACGDDPDLFLSRRPTVSPTAFDASSQKAAGRPDTLTFLSAKDGMVYACVHPYAAGGGSTCSYRLRVYGTALGW